MINEKIKFSLRKLIIWAAFIIFTCFFACLAVALISYNDFLTALLSIAFTLFCFHFALDESNRLGTK